MSEIHYFPRYSQPENFVTNNTLLLLLRLHQYNRFKFEAFMEKLCEYSGEDIQLGSTSLQFSQQKPSGKSVVDGFISQESIKIAVETKLFDHFSPPQLKNHLAIFGNEQHKLLILLNPSPSSVDERQFNLVRETAKKENIQVVHTSFEEIIDSARKCLSELDEEMRALVDDYESFCSSRRLLPRDKYTLFVPPCGESFYANQKYRLYYCPTSRSLRNAKYLGIYKDRSVRLIGQIAKVVACNVDTDSRTIQVADGRKNSLTQEEKSRILVATEEARIRKWNLSADHQFILCDALYDTDFRKDSKWGIYNRRYFDLEKVLKAKPPADVKDLANLLRSHTWEEDHL
jgi:hypothetical protein